MSHDLVYILMPFSLSCQEYLLGQLRSFHLSKMELASCSVISERGNIS